MKNENSAKDTLDTAPKTLIPPQALLDIIAKLAVENYALGMFEIDETDVFRPAIKPIAKAWELPEHAAEHTLRAIRVSCVGIDEGTHERDAFPELSGKQILAVFAALTESLVRLDSREDRRAVAELMGFLKDYWAISDSLN